MYENAAKGPIMASHVLGVFDKNYNLLNPLKWKEISTKGIFAEKCRFSCLDKAEEVLKGR
jgi:hypothetical protein